MINQMNEYIAITTFSRRPVLPQIFAYLYSLSLIITFYVVMPDQIKNFGARISLTILFSIFSILIILMTILISCSDPTDPVMIHSKYSQSNPKIPDNSRHLEMPKSQHYSSKTNYLYCQQCESYVSKSAKHCRICQRCVLNFDHHCMWLNNCIGQLNYVHFLVLLWGVQLQLTTYITSVIYVWNGNRQIQQQMGEMIVVSILGVMAIVFWLMNGVLAVFHIFLIYNNMTSFQFITAQKQAGASNNQIHPSPDDRQQENKSSNEGRKIQQQDQVSHQHQFNSLELTETYLQDRNQLGCNHSPDLDGIHQHNRQQYGINPHCEIQIDRRSQRRENQSYQQEIQAITLSLRKDKQSVAEELKTNSPSHVLYQSTDDPS